MGYYVLDKHMYSGKILSEYLKSPVTGARPCGSAPPARKWPRWTLCRKAFTLPCSLKAANMKLQRSVLGIMAVLCLTLCGCKGRPLPDGMEEAALLGAGQEVVLLMAGGDYTSVYDALREDVAVGTSLKRCVWLSVCSNC